MKKGFLRTFLYGLIIWVIPFIVASALWDPATNAPRISQDLFNGIMGLSWAIAFSIAAVGYFKPIKKISKKESWKTGLTWYLTVVILEFVFIVLIFGNSFADFAPLILIDTPTLIVTGVVGTIMSRR